MSLLVLALETLLAPAIAAAVFLRFLLSARRGALAGLAEELPERLGTLSPAARAALRGRRVWWLHAASAGEVAGLAPLIEALALRPDPPAVLLTTTTASGRQAARRLPGVAWAQLAPADLPWCVARFLAAAAPERLILAETELWPAMLILAGRAGLRPVLLNARLSESSSRAYRALRPLLAPALARLEAVAAQSEEDAARWRGLGVPAARVLAAGNMKHDRPADEAALRRAREARAALFWDGAPLLVAGSTHAPEEEAVLGAFAAARERLPRLRLAVAPRHLERAADAWARLNARGLRCARLSELSSAPAEAEALLVDEMGVLPGLYAGAWAAFVGGTLVEAGGHNLLEPAAAGVPVLFGPHTEHIEGPASLLERRGGRRVGDAAQLREALRELAGDPKAAARLGAEASSVAAGLRGATGRCLILLGLN